jgi:hypothetical protein
LKLWKFVFADHTLPLFYFWEVVSANLYYLCAQDIFGVPVQLRRNCDTVWLFAGMTDKSMFGMMMAQLGLDSGYWPQYHSLGFRDVMVVNYLPTGTVVTFINN